MSYAKLFSSITESSLWSASKETRLLFVSMLARANAVGFVEASIPGLARISNLSREETELALAELMAPDPDDKSGNNEGRRIIKMDGGWGIVNYEVYRNRRDEEERREYMREYMARYRKKHVNLSKQSKPQLAKAEAEAEAKKKEEISSPTAPETPMKGKARKVFVPPTVDEVDAYCVERQNTVDAEKFVDYYEARGWMVGKSKMSNWQAAVRTWEKNDQERKPATGSGNPHTPGSEQWHWWNASNAV